MSRSKRHSSARQPVTGPVERSKSHGSDSVRLKGHGAGRLIGSLDESSDEMKVSEKKSGLAHLVLQVVEDLPQFHDLIGTAEQRPNGTSTSC